MSHFDPCWVVQILADGDAEPRHIVCEEHQAHRIACQLVQNRVAGHFGNCYLYGPGNGTTSVLVRQMTREQIWATWPDAVCPAT